MDNSVDVKMYVYLRTIAKKKALAELELASI